MSEPFQTARVQIAVDRAAAMPLSDQICASLRAAILEGRIEPGARLPSWRDLATQLGVARGTVRIAYERLIDELLIVSAGAAGTRVVKQPVESQRPALVEIERPFRKRVRDYSAPPLPFQMGVPAQDGFPAKLWSRIYMRTVRERAAAPTSYPDPRGEPELRAQIASYLAIARGVRCVPDQVMVTSGFRGALGLAIQTLNIAGCAAWLEDPGFPVTRMGLELAGMKPVPVPVDEKGLNVERGMALAPHAALAVVTPGQQAPTGVTLSMERRKALLHWAAESGAWIIEDDYLSELQLKGRAAPALASLDLEGRVVHIGSFSKTLSPSLSLGFLVAPPALAGRFGELTACLSPAPNPTTQLAVARFFANGHYLRHLRHMKRLYVARRDALRTCLGKDAGVEEAMSGLALSLRLQPGTDDVAMARRAPQYGILPAALSPWYIDADRRSPGLLLSVTNLRDDCLKPACASLIRLLSEFDVQALRHLS